MNETYERLVNENNQLKKTLNNQKNSHQNTLQMLQASNKIIDELKQFLREEQKKNSTLCNNITTRELKFKQLAEEYQRQIEQIKALIDRKDQQISHYTSKLKVTDYDMIRLRVINEIQHSHSEEVETLKQEIQKQQFLSNQANYQLRLMSQKNLYLSQQLEQLKESFAAEKDEVHSKHIQQMNRIYTTLQQQKQLKKQFQRRIKDQKQKYQKKLKNYQEQLLRITQSISLNHQGKENQSRFGNFPGEGDKMLRQRQLEKKIKELDNQVEKKQNQIRQTKQKYKTQIQEQKKKIFQLQSELQFKDQSLRETQHQLSFKLQILEKDKIKLTTQHQKQLQQLKNHYENRIKTLENEIKNLKFQIQSQSERKQIKLTDSISNFGNDMYQTMKKQNYQLKNQIQQLQQQLTQISSKQQNQGRQRRTQSNYSAKDKLKQANAQIVSLLRDKIDLNEKIKSLEGRQ